MSHPTSEIAELAAKAEELQKSLDTVARRLDQIRAERDATVVTRRPRAAAWWKQPLVVGVLSSAATAVVVGGLAGLLSSAGDSTPAAIPPPVAPAPIAIIPPPATPCRETPAPPVTVEAPPPPPVPRRPRVERAAPSVPSTNPPTDPFASPTSAVGSLTVVCMPARCVEIVDNGVPIGPGHIFSRPTSAGRHTLVLKTANGQKKTVTVEILPDQMKEVRLYFDDREDPFKSAL